MQQQQQQLQISTATIKNNDNCNNTKRICGAEANATTDPFHTQKLLRLNNMFLVIVEMNQMKKINCSQHLI